MAVKTVASMGRLMRLAKEVGKAKQSGDETKLTKAQANLKHYEAIVLKADIIMLHNKKGCV